MVQLSHLLTTQDVACTKLARHMAEICAGLSCVSKGLNLDGKHEKHMASYEYYEYYKYYEYDAYYEYHGWKHDFKH